MEISCENVVLWRGHFEATGKEKSVNLTINGGEGLFCGSRKAIADDLISFCS